MSKPALVTLVHADGSKVKVDADRVGLYESAGWVVKDDSSK